MARFFAPDLPEGGEIFLAGDEAHHMVRVRRQKPGDVVVLFDGRGRWAEARIERFEKAGVTIRILHTHVETPEA
ncbi:MAG: 16S rRNA (uracil(1498)-N(3))-methyltransferase, partial [Phycisphaerae bacterium]|nr:16S rRNA (uracil(1498)-N(3))-methyltransferase [Phycisphaerae bacterium]